MFHAFRKTILAFSVLFVVAFLLIFVQLLPVRKGNTDQKTENRYPQTNIGKSNEPQKPYVAIQPSILLKKNMQENPQLKGIYDSIEAYRQTASTLVVSESALTSKMEEMKIAKNLFPTYYLKSLVSMQDGFIKMGWMKEEDKVAFTTEQNVFDFLKRTVVVMADHNAYQTKEDVESAKRAVNLFPQLWAMERQQYKKKSTILYQPYSPSTQVSISPENSVFYKTHKKSILDGFFSALVPQTAQAQVSQYIDTFVTIPDCWKSKNEQNLKGGDNLMAICCNCGLCIIPPYRYEFEYDCGAPTGGDCGDTDCNIPLGCLNATCGPPNMYNAIFDGPSGYRVPATAGWGGGMNFDWSFTC
ncbi:MAG: hypothetical protein AAB482_00995, partial [Patescibacteria group bacterium]